MWPAQRLLKYGIVTGVTVGTLVSLKANQYNLDSVGIVRLGRAAVTVSMCFDEVQACDIMHTSHCSVIIQIILQDHMIIV
jgi:hypothetical protein